MTTGPAPITGKDWQNHVEPRIMAEDLRALEQGIKQALDGGGGSSSGIVVDGWTPAGSVPDPDPELITVTATAPNWIDDTASGGGSWTTPTITGVTYSPASGTASPGQTVTVTATAQTGYQLSGTSNWSHSFPAAPAGPAIVQTKVAHGASVTLDAAPTLGNLLVVGVGTNADPADFEFSHGLILDGTVGPEAGWYVGIASGIVQPDAAATITVTGVGSNPRLSVWEVSGVTGFTGAADEQLTADDYGKQLTFSTDGDVVLVHVHTDGAPGALTPSGGLILDSQANDTRGISAHAIPVSQPWSGAITWTNGRRAIGIAGGYA